MAVERIGAAEAIARLKGNAYRTWPARDGRPNRAEPIARPWFDAGFRFEPGDGVLTIGSCFARNIEAALVRRGFSVPSLVALERDDRFRALGSSVLNTYSVASIANELSWALDASTPFREADGFVTMGEDRYVDLHMSQWFEPAPLDAVRRRREAIRTVYAELPACRVVVMTLGLTECWFDRVSGLYIARPPKARLVEAFPDRFELHVLDHAETLAYLRRALALIGAKGHASVRVALTVSPVPLTNTFRAVDVMVANSYSKAVLRAAAEEIVATVPFAHYVPSYEAVMGTARDLAFQDDMVHVRPTLVDTIVDDMLERLGATGGPEKAATSTPERLAKGLKEAAQRTVDEILADPSLLAGQQPLMELFVTTCLKLRRYRDARTGLDLMGDDVLTPEAGLLRAQLDVAEHAFGAARARLAALERSALSQRPDFWIAFLQACFADGQVDLGVAVAERAIKRLPRNPAVYHAAALELAKAGDPARAETMFRAARRRANAWPRLDIDFADFLFVIGKGGEARRLMAEITPTHPSHHARLAEISRRFEHA